VGELRLPGGPWAFQVVYAAASAVGVGLAGLLYLRFPGYAHFLATNAVGSLLHKLLLAGWGFDWLYRGLVIRPYIWLARLNRNDFVDAIYLAVAHVARGVNRLSSLSVNGNVRWYVAALGTGAVLVLALLVML
jgi:NADH-quinone oxidoreductase subunit L